MTKNPETYKEVDGLSEWFLHDGYRVKLGDLYKMDVDEVMSLYRYYRSTASRMSTNTKETIRELLITKKDEEITVWLENQKKNKTRKKFKQIRSILREEWKFIRQASKLR